MFCGLVITGQGGGKLKGGILWDMLNCLERSYEFDTSQSLGHERSAIVG